MIQWKVMRVVFMAAVWLLLAGCAGGSIAGPAGQYLPAQVDLPGYLAEQDNLGLQRIVEQTPVRALPEDSAYINFDNSGFSFTTQPQDGVYLRVAYWLVVLRSDGQAGAFFRQSSQEAAVKSRLSVVMPSTIQQAVEQVQTLPVKPGSCQEAALFKVHSEVIYTPDLYLFALCRVDNAVVQVWAYTADNYDGNNTPIPEDVIADQMAHWVSLATAPLKP